MVKFTLSEAKFNRLTESADWSNRQLAFLRAKRLESIRQLVGSNYAFNGAQRPVPAPLIRLAVAIYVRQLVPGVPRVMLSTPNDMAKPTVANLEIAVNDVPERIGLRETLRKVVTESLFTIGVLKMGLHAAGKMLNHEVGKTFADIVTIDDLVMDMSAKIDNQMQYIGNSYWMDYDEVVGSRKLGEYSNLKDLTPDEYENTLQGDDGQDRAETVTVNESPTLYRDRIRLRDLWLPDEGKLVTYAATDRKLLRIVDWDGPEGGPYLRLGYEYVPGNLLPLPPVASWLDLHELANSLFRKLGRQADAEKTIATFQGGDTDDAIAFNGAKDGTAISYHGQPPNNINVGGANPNTMGVFQKTVEMFSYFGGNLDSMGGLAAQAETLGQDRLMSQASSAQMKDMADSVTAFVKLVFEHITHYEWSDKASSRTLQKEVPGSDLKVPVRFGAAAKKGSLASTEVEVETDVYSMQDRSPQTQLSKLLSLFERVVVPLIPAIQAEGGALSTQSILADIARYGDAQEISQWVQYTQTDGSTTGYDQSGMPQNTTRRYERVSGNSDQSDRKSPGVEMSMEQPSSQGGQ